MNDNVPSANPCCIATERQVERLKAEVEQVRSMFDVTRHRVCDRLGLPHSTAWNNVESECASLRAALAESEARRAEAEGLLTDEREDADAMLTRTRNSLTTELNASLQRAEAAESSLAAAVEVLRQVDAKRHGSCWWCGRMPGEGHGNGCDLARALGGGRG